MEAALSIINSSMEHPVIVIVAAEEVLAIRKAGNRQQDWEMVEPVGTYTKVVQEYRAHRT
jgi:hypothetical protein